MYHSKSFQSGMATLEVNLRMISKLLGQYSVPFFSPRYIAHMNSDTSMPATLGYLTAMLYNQNNNAPEGSPLTNIIENCVGQDLCSMLGYRTRPDDERKDTPLAWGQIVCGGSVANIQSMW